MSGKILNACFQAVLRLNTQEYFFLHCDMIHYGEAGASRSYLMVWVKCCIRQFFSKNSRFVIIFFLEFCRKKYVFFIVFSSNFGDKNHFFFFFGFQTKGRGPKKNVESLTAVKPRGWGGQRVGGHTPLGYFFPCSKPICMA